MNIINCIFENNIATFGGGIFHRGYNGINIFNCIFTNNFAVNDGGGLLSGQYICIKNSLFYNNNSEDQAGGIRFDCSFGGGYDDKTIITNTNFINNSSQNSPSGLLVDVVTLNLTNVVLWGNTIGVLPSI